MIDMNRNLQTRKQQLVRNAIYEAAIDLFADKGFDETTVDEIAEAAGVSRRSFFRYFASKDDLLAQDTLQYGLALQTAIESAPRNSTPLELLQGATLSMTRHVTSLARARKTIEIAARSASARQAYLSRMPEVEDNLTSAYAVRLKDTSGQRIKPRLLASLTLSIANVALVCWFRGEYKDIASSSKQVFLNLSRIFSEQ